MAMGTIDFNTNEMIVKFGDIPLQDDCFSGTIKIKISEDFYQMTKIEDPHWVFLGKTMKKISSEYYRGYLIQNNCKQQNKSIADYYKCDDGRDYYFGCHDDNIFWLGIEQNGVFVMLVLEKLKAILLLLNGEILFQEILDYMEK